MPFYFLQIAIYFIILSFPLQITPELLVMQKFKYQPSHSKVNVLFLYQHKHTFKMTKYLIFVTPWVKEVVIMPVLPANLKRSNPR
jgi:hypothetical protein